MIPVRTFFQILHSYFNFVIDSILLNGFVFLILFEYVSLGESSRQTRLVKESQNYTPSRTIL